MFVSISNIDKKNIDTDVKDIDIKYRYQTYLY